MTSSFAPNNFSTPFTQHQRRSDSTFDFPSTSGKNFSKFYKTISNQIDVLYKSIAPNLKLYKYLFNSTRSTDTTHTVTVGDILNGYLIANGPTTITFPTNLPSDDILSTFRNNCYDIGTPVLKLFILNINSATVTVNGTKVTTSPTLLQNQGLYVLVYLNNNDATFVPI